MFDQFLPHYSIVAEQEQTSDIGVLQKGLLQRQQMTETERALSIALYDDVVILSPIGLLDKLVIVCCLRLQCYPVNVSILA